MNEIEEEVLEADTLPPISVSEPEHVLPRPLPEGDMTGWMGRMKSGQGTVRLWVTEVNGQPYECYIVLGKSGSDLMALAEGIGRMISIALRAGIPVEIIVDQLKGIGGSRSVGFGAKRVLSVPDAIAKILECHYFPDVADEEEIYAGGAGQPAAAAVAPVALAAPRRQVERSKPQGDLCPECGNATLLHVEGCKKCACGYSEC